ncbi:MAG TPA: hypothetical protein PKH95_04140 [Candidatus Magasanikbacteria bacterium]|nr:hypothetical protein [Candidatus Magasanikbacteria bacterium]
MNWLEKAKEETIKQVEKIRQLIEDRYSYGEKIDELRELYQKSKNKKITELFSDADSCLKEWQNGPMLSSNSPAMIISAAKEYKKKLNELIAEINQELFPC